MVVLARLLERLATIFSELETKVPVLVKDKDGSHHDTMHRIPNSAVVDGIIEDIRRDYSKLEQTLPTLTSRTQPLSIDHDVLTSLEKQLETLQNSTLPLLNNRIAGNDDMEKPDLNIEYQFRKKMTNIDATRKKSVTAASTTPKTITKNEDPHITRKVVRLDRRSRSTALQNAHVVLQQFTDSDTHVCIPLPLSQRMKPHQHTGTKFMYDTVVRDGVGVLLADHMGLGKTLQVIALLESSWMYNNDLGRCLVVCPAMCIATWHNELSCWLNPKHVIGSEREYDECPDHVPRQCTIAIGEMHGGLLVPYVFSLDKVQATRLQTTQYREESVKQWKKYGGVMIVTYDLLVSLQAHDMEVLDTALANDILHSCDVIICDEAHVIKNQNLKQKLLSEVVTTRRICLTGIIHLCMIVISRLSDSK